MKRLQTPETNRRGTTIILMLVLLVVVFTFTAFAVDLGRVQLAQLKLQVASDFAARSGAEAMSRGVGDPDNALSYENAIRDEVNMVMMSNSMFGSTVNFDPASQIEFGQAIRNGAQFEFTPTASGSMDNVTNSLRVDPNLGQFPMLFGQFTGRDSVALSTATTVKVQDRDIVLVVDRSTSMFDHDAGTMPIVEYNANLMALEESLYGPTDPFHTDNIPLGSVRHSEFELIAGTDLNLSRTQALKLAILKFREQIDLTRSREQLGLVSYSNEASTPADVTIATPDSDIDILASLSGAVVAEIIDNQVTESSGGDTLPHEHIACALVDDSDNYDSFDFNYLRMRCCANTNIAAGIIEGANVLHGAGTRSYATPILIVMTDGKHNQESTPEEAADTVLAANPDTLIYTITFGDGAEQDPMIAVANKTDGRHFHASNVDDLVEVFEDLATNAGVVLIE